jgi:hypothetical protein
MAKSTTIDLIDPIVWPDKPLNQLILKEPTGGLYSDLGEPRILVRNIDGAGYYVEQVELIRKYLDACLDIDGGASVLRMLSLADAMRIKAALFDFFTDADVAISSRNKTSSSSR